MVELFCAIVGTEGSAFEVDTDEGASVSALKKAIKEKNSTAITCDAKDLQLFLAKKDEGRGAWVTEEEAISGAGDTTNLKLLKSARAAIGDVGLSEDEVRLQVTKKEVEDLKGPVNVLVVVPESLGVDFQLLQLQEALLQHTILNSPSSTSAQSQNFKASLISATWGRIRTTSRTECCMGTYQDDMENRMLR
ncbi:unnamed protein product [Phytophthora lilii]|uniref:Unnamed protein product n=1 Tax=Phytophthora lilii TaxID=2077276 RepID=A0A9W6X600_9STRA|nr:unnamed protein product [Phytophthora lilii]